MLSQRQEPFSPHRRVRADWRGGHPDPAVRAFLGMAGADRRGADSIRAAADSEIGGEMYGYARDLRESAPRPARFASDILERKKACKVAERTRNQCRVLSIPASGLAFAIAAKSAMERASPRIPSGMPQLASHCLA